MKITITTNAGSVFTLADDSVAVVIGSMFAAGAGGRSRRDLSINRKGARRPVPCFERRMRC